MTAPAPLRRRWFRNSLRTLFVLVTGAALMTGAIIAVDRAWKWNQKFEREVMWGTSANSATMTFQKSCATFLTRLRTGPPPANANARRRSLFAVARGMFRLGRL